MRSIASPPRGPVGAFAMALSALFGGPAGSAVLACCRASSGFRVPSGTAPRFKREIKPINGSLSGMISQGARPEIVFRTVKQNEVLQAHRVPAEPARLEGCRIRFSVARPPKRGISLVLREQNRDEIPAGDGSGGFFSGLGPEPVRTATIAQAIEKVAGLAGRGYGPRAIGAV